MKSSERESNISPIVVISFTTSASSAKGERLFAPLGATSVAELAQFDAIKTEDLEIGTRFGANPAVPRTFIDPKTHTYLHGQAGVLASIKRRA
ncbi:hypothetical protein A2616_02005 [Candidatus Woesebacteria bacterium RIFOXYD1_FULL_33_11]|nr:MAG: hypothetical protein A2616_02005 [Candidatus Woesebacteria bacterium RIFOXYD1_FULL_33_11]